ncbi:hypothetical protein FGO68_gene11810 [Halteria grandinella]|uniref:Bidirectional sugar transporter SWEET n=1 Tax=Halteria grandinella TaxID=5974 RepID=A0A8J8SZC7_HALGN|nr:hypothetical protein FGO68_gene11810 [Halteria grandinella]
MIITILVDILPKIGLIIGFFFSILPFPLLYRAIVKGDQREIISLSIPATILGLCCTSAVYAYCHQKALSDCVTSSYMGFASSGLTLLTVYSLRGDFRTLLMILSLQFALVYSVNHIFKIEVTQALTLILNTLACVVGPLDTLDNLMRTRDINYMNFTMHFLALINGFIWTSYHYLNHTTSLALANALGIVCEFFLFTGCLTVTQALSPNHPVSLLTNTFLEVMFRMPKKMLQTGEVVPVKRFEEELGAKQYREKIE